MCDNMRITKVVLTSVFAVLATVQCANSQTDLSAVTCNGDNAQFADVLYVKDGERLTFTCVDCNCADKDNWMTGNTRILSNQQQYNVTTVTHPSNNGNCNFELQMIAVPRHIHYVIHCTKDDNRYLTNQICSGNKTAHYIILQFVSIDNTSTCSPTSTPMPTSSITDAIMSTTPRPTESSTTHYGACSPSVSCPCALPTISPCSCPPCQSSMNTGIPNSTGKTEAPPTADTAVLEVSVSVGAVSVFIISAISLTVGIIVVLRKRNKKQIDLNSDQDYHVSNPMRENVNEMHSDLDVSIQTKKVTVSTASTAEEQEPKDQEASHSPD